MSMLDGHPFNFPLFELYCAPIYAPIAHHFFMNVRKHLSSFRSLQAQKMRYSFIFNDLCQTVKNSVRCVTNHNAQFHICSQLLCCLAWHAIPFKNLTRLLIITHPSLFLKARLDFRCDFCLNFLWMPVLPYSAASRIVSVILRRIEMLWIRSLSNHRPNHHLYHFKFLTTYNKFISRIYLHSHRNKPISISQPWTRI